MKAIYYYLHVIICLLLVACDSDDENLKPSYEDTNWYVIKDNPSNDLDHLIYTVYSDTGVPIFYNDTIGWQERGLDGYGDPIIYYEVLSVNYTIDNATDYVSYALSEKSEDIESAVDLLKDKVLPYLKKGMRPQCYLLVDELILSGFKAHEEGVYRGMTTTVIGRLKEIKNMNTEEQNRFAAEIRAAGLGYYIQKYYSENLSAFYGVSVVLNNGQPMSLYGQAIMRFGGSVPYKAYKDYGFLNADADYSASSFSYNAPKREQDVTAYVTEVLLNDDDAFLSKYAGYEWILRKYDFMKKVVVEVLSDLK